MRYKITVESTTDKTDTFSMEGDAVIAFVGKLNASEKEIEHGMGFAGNKLIMSEVISTIPYQIKTLLEEELKKNHENNVVKPEPAKSEIILPKDFKKGKTNN